MKTCTPNSRYKWVRDSYDGRKKRIPTTFSNHEDNNENNFYDVFRPKGQRNIISHTLVLVRLRHIISRKSSAVRLDKVSKFESVSTLDVSRFRPVGTHNCARVLVIYCFLNNYGRASARMRKRTISFGFEIAVERAYAIRGGYHG